MEANTPTRSEQSSFPKKKTLKTPIMPRIAGSNLAANSPMPNNFRHIQSRVKKRGGSVARDLENRKVQKKSLSGDECCNEYSSSSHMLWKVSLWTLRKKEHRTKTIRKSVIEEKILTLDFTAHQSSYKRFQILPNFIIYGSR